MNSIKQIGALFHRKSQEKRSHASNHQSDFYETAGGDKHNTETKQQDREELLFTLPRHKSMFESFTIDTQPNSRASSMSMRSSTLSAPRKSTMSSFSGNKDSLVREMRNLEFSLKQNDYFQVLLQLVPTVEVENKLRLTRALIDVRTALEVKDDVKARVLQNLLFTNFLQPVADSKLYVPGLPFHLLDLDGWNDQLLQHLLKELLQHQEVTGTLVQWNHLDENDENATSSSGEEEDGKESDEQLCKLSDAIMDPDLRRELLKRLVASSSSNLLVKIRFVAAIDQLSSCESKAERQKLEASIRQIFLTKGSMFYLEEVGKKTKLTVAKEQVLQSLQSHPDVCNALISMSEH